MKKLVILLALVLPNLAAAADSYAQNQEKMRLMQQIQHTKPHPDQYLSSLQEQQNKPVSIDVRSDGHYYAPVEINGRPIEMMADTGASSIFISQEDARKMGIQTSNLNYNISYSVAGGGTVYAAQTTAKTLKVGGIELQNVPISIAQKGNGAPLLGMSFFKNLSKYEVKDGQLLLYK